MPRKRMIDPNIWQSEDFSKLSPFARLIFIGLFSIADDAGRGRAKPSYIKSTLFPYDDMRVADVDKALSEIGPNMSVTFYRTHDGSEYYSLDKWRKWQKVEKPSESILPAYDDTCEAIRGTFPERSENDREPVAPNRKEENRKENIYSDVIRYLNEKAGTDYRDTSKKTRSLIDARVSEGFSLSDFKRVIDNKCFDWNHEPSGGEKEMRGYLRPETLFGTKFEGYLNQKGAPAAPVEHKPLPPPGWLNKENPSIEEVLGVRFQ